MKVKFVLEVGQTRKEELFEYDEEDYNDDMLDDELNKWVDQQVDRFLEEV